MDMMRWCQSLSRSPFSLCSKIMLMRMNPKKECRVEQTWTLLMRRASPPFTWRPGCFCLNTAFPCQGWSGGDCPDAGQSRGKSARDQPRRLLLICYIAAIRGPNHQLQILQPGKTPELLADFVNEQPMKVLIRMIFYASH